MFNVARALVCFSLTAFFVFSCMDSVKKGKDRTSFVNNQFVGNWKDPLDTNSWVFDENVLSYGGYHHFYKQKKDTLYVSQIPYVIKFLSEDSIVLFSVRSKSIIQLTKQ